MGNRRGRHDARGTLFADIATVLEATEPDGFVLENVRALRSVNGGTLFREIIATLSQTLGYNLAIWELNAVDYGVPQVRRRIFIVGSRRALPEAAPPTTPASHRRHRTAWHLLERDVNPKYYLSDRILRTVLKDEHGGYRRRAEINRLIARPLTRTMHKMHRASQDNYYSDDFVHGLYDAAQDVVHMNPRFQPRIRRLTPREAFRVQGFPEDLTDSALASGVSDTQLYMQIGNAVPPPLAAAVIDHAFS